MTKKERVEFDMLKVKVAALSEMVATILRRRDVPFYAPPATPPAPKSPYQQTSPWPADNYPWVVWMGTGTERP